MCWYQLMIFPIKGQAALVFHLFWVLTQIHSSAQGHGWTRNNELDLYGNRDHFTQAALSVVGLGSTTEAFMGHSMKLSPSSEVEMQPVLRCPDGFSLWAKMVFGQGPNPSIWPWLLGYSTQLIQTLRLLHFFPSASDKRKIIGFFHWLSAQHSSWP